MIKKGLEDNVSIIKEDKHRHYIWLKIMTPNGTPTFW